MSLSDSGHRSHAFVEEVSRVLRVPSGRLCYVLRSAWQQLKLPRREVDLEPQDFDRLTERAAVLLDMAPDQLVGALALAEGFLRIRALNPSLSDSQVRAVYQRWAQEVTITEQEDG